MNQFQTTGPRPDEGRAHQPATHARQLPAMQPGEQVKVMLVPGEPVALTGTGIEVMWEADDCADPLAQSPLVLSVRVRSREELATGSPDVAQLGSPATHSIDGADLRRARERLRMSLRRVVSISGFSYGYLTKVERCEPGRPVTPEVVAAYRKAGVVLPGVAVGVCSVPSAEDQDTALLMTPGGEWRTRNNEARAGR